jgi:hypothetical protein
MGFDIFLWHKKIVWISGLVARGQGAGLVRFLFRPDMRRGHIVPGNRGILYCILTYGSAFAHLSHPSRWTILATFLLTVAVLLQATVLARVV